MPINESYHISSFRSRKFIDCFFDSCLISSFQIGGRTLKQSLEIPILTRELYVFTRKDLCFGSQVVCEIFFVLDSAFLRSILIAKIISPVIFDTDHSFKRLNTLFLTKNLFIKVFMMRRSRLVIFYFKEEFCVLHASTSRLRDVNLSAAFGALVEKNLSLVVFDSNCPFKTVKCSFFNQIIVYQSFYGAHV